MDSPETHIPSPADKTSALIIGCGYLGQRLAERRRNFGATVYASVRSQDQTAKLARALPGVRLMICDTTQPVTLSALRPALESDEPLDVFHLVPPGRATAEHDPRSVILDGTQNVIDLLNHPRTTARIRRAIWVSSSAVYGDHQGAIIDTDAPARPDTPRAQLIHEGEQRWLAGGSPFRVLRLAGIYGPGRIPGLKAVASGAPIVGDPTAPLNLIHVDDAAALLDCLAASESAARIELGADGTPRPRGAYYAHLAQRMEQPAPSVLSTEEAVRHLHLDEARRDRLSRSASKALIPRSTQQRTGWQPNHPDALPAIDRLLTEAARTVNRPR